MEKEFIREITDSSLDLREGWETRLRGNLAERQYVKAAAPEAITIAHI